jgi:arabinan endo-1,5-alpha-L-arabinosidase
MSHRLSMVALLAAALLAAVLVPALGLAPSAAAVVGPGRVTGDVTAHDPSMVKGSSGYQLYSTHDGIQTRTSPDRTAFSRGGQALASVPSWVSTYNSSGDVWAPDVSIHDGKYLMYYAASSFRSNNSAIGLATSTTGAAGSFRDQGIVYSSSTADNFNAIDPALLVDTAGTWWLSFGSFFSGIYLIRLDASTGKQSTSDKTRYPLAFRPPDPHAIEAPYIVAHGGFYYLFVSFDRCCQGTSSTYRIMVGRSSSPTGPYADKSGAAMSNGAGTQLLATHDNIIGPGGQSILHDSDGDLLVYHYYDGNNNGTPTLGINLLGWDSSGWPFVH